MFILQLHVCIDIYIYTCCSHNGADGIANSLETYTCVFGNIAYVSESDLQIYFKFNCSNTFCVLVVMKLLIIRMLIQVISNELIVLILTSLNWSHNGSKNYTVDSLSETGVNGD